MSSLVTSASIWTNDSPNKKRTSSIRKTLKKHPEPKPIDEMNDMGEDYLSEKENYQNMIASSFDDTQSVQNDRATRVNDILNKITSVDNDTNKMGSFKPLPNPNYELKKDVNDNSMILGSMPPLGYDVPSYSNAGNSFKDTTDGRFSSNMENSQMAYGNYQRMYDPTTVYYKPNLVATGRSTQPSVQQPMDSKLMEKINYMIRLLEEQQMEKTSNITEEFILYSFLGVFIIFIVDSFSRSGKYTR